MRERQREGIAKARRDGKYRGRQPTAHDKAAEVAALAAAGLGKRNIACRLQIEHGERL
jgi:DNA invertase Pin-like site-specific DNA recombinase